MTKLDEYRENITLHLVRITGDLEYLKEKVDRYITHLQYVCADSETWSNFDDQCKRYDFYNDWLNKINKKYNYA